MLALQRDGPAMKRGDTVVLDEATCSLAWTKAQDALSAFPMEAVMRKTLDSIAAERGIEIAVYVLIGIGKIKEPEADA